MKILTNRGGCFIGPSLIHFLIDEIDWAVVNTDKLTHAGNFKSLVLMAGFTCYGFAHATNDD